MDVYKRNGTYTLREAHDQFELEFKRFERKTLIWFEFSKNKSNWSWYKKCISQENILWTFKRLKVWKIIHMNIWKRLG